MGDFVTTLLTLPTLLFTAPLGLAILYWLFVVVGAVDLDVLDGADGALELGDGGLDGALEGLDGAADGVDAALDALDGGADADLEVDGHHANALATLLSVLGLNRVPLTVSLSFVLLFGWLASVLASIHLAPALPIAGVAVDTGIFLGSGLLGTLAASVAVRPLSGLFHTERGRGNRSFIGAVVTITTAGVDPRYGQAELALDGHHLIVQVRDLSAQGLGKGDRALLVQWDKELPAFVVEKLEPKLDDATSRQEALERARRRLLAARDASRSAQ